MNASKSASHFATVREEKTLFVQNRFIVLEHYNANIFEDLDFSDSDEDMTMTKTSLYGGC